MRFSERGTFHEDLPSPEPDESGAIPQVDPELIGSFQGAAGSEAEDPVVGSAQEPEETLPEPGRQFPEKMIQFAEKRNKGFAVVRRIDPVKCGFKFAFLQRHHPGGSLRTALRRKDLVQREAGVTLPAAVP